MADHSRRSFLTLGGAAALGAIAPGGVKAAAGPSYAMIVDLNRCTGCGACVVACKAWNDVEYGRFRTRVSETEVESGGAAWSSFKPMLCSHCADAPCAGACPAKAIIALDNGVVVTDRKACVGDGACAAACPFQARFIDSRTGKADSCDFCLGRLERGLLPACVENCPPAARLFGDLNAPAGEFGKALGQGGLVSASPELNLRTRVLYTIPRKGRS